MLNEIKAKAPDSQFLSQFFHPTLLQSKPYKLTVKENLTKLDQNESPFDWPQELKEEILRKLGDTPWNTYPQDYPEELKKALGARINVSEKNIVLSPGSNYHISVLLNLFSAKKPTNQIVLTRPSFPLFEGHCLYQNIPYEIWPLNDSYEYDLDLLPELKPGASVFFASPNNPVGNSLPQKDLLYLLKKYPDCYFIADEAYWEFAEQDFSKLLEDFSNLFIVRTFSKAMSSAGIRLSYILASEALCEQIKKLTLPFLINKFTSIAVTTALKSDQIMDKIKKSIAYQQEEKAKVFNELQKINTGKYFEVLNSHTNFLCLTCNSEGSAKKIAELFKEHQIVIRNVSGPGLPNTLRITMGKKEANLRVISILKDFLKQEQTINS